LGSLLRDGPVQIPKVMLPKIVHALPEIGFTVSVENLCSCRSNTCLICAAKQEPPSPGAVLYPPQFQSDSHNSALVPERRELVNDWICWVGYAVADWAPRHVQSPVGLRKYKGIQHLRNMIGPRKCEVLQIHHTVIAGIGMPSDGAPGNSDPVDRDGTEGHKEKEERRPPVQPSAHR